MPNQFEKFSTEFWESGITAVDKIFDKCKSLGLEIKKDGIGLELGAGVGRLTFPLAKRIEKLLALDVSVSNLAVLKEKNQFFENIQPILIENLDDIKKFEKIDLFISLITLQHNPPPIQEFILKNIFKTFNHGAIGVFQIPIQTPHFKFNTEEFLNSSEREMDMFSFPLSRIYEICREVDVSVVHVEQDNLAGPKHLSCTFFIRKN
jgi:SAM-dependent methyltransferase